MKTKLEELIKELEKEKATAQDVLDNENVHPDCKQQREGYIIAFSFVIQKVQKILNDLPDKRSDYLRVCDYLWKQGFLNCNESEIQSIVNDLLQTLR
jgi:hypothetical protein